MRRYRGFIADNDRWNRFELRPDDVIVATPSKCGTTWMQNIVAMLLHDTTELDVPISVLCPWLDMLTHSEEELVELLEAQAHRRAIKTHTPLDGLPEHPTVTYITVFRHPLDAALSNQDHMRNMDLERTVALRGDAVGLDDLDLEGDIVTSPHDPGDYLRWFLTNDSEPSGAGMNNLADYAHTLRCAWDRRTAANAHLFHFADLQADLDGQMRRVATALGTPVDERRWPAFVDAATFESMKSRAAMTAPHAHTGLWQSDGDFYRRGGRRDWASLLSADEIGSFERQLEELVGPEACRFALHGSSNSAPHLTNRPHPVDP